MTERLPTEAEKALYREVLAQGGRVMFREAMRQDPDATLGLIELGLLIHFDEDESLTAVNPRSIAERLSAELRAGASRKLAEADRTSGHLEDLVHAFETTAKRADHAVVVQHVDRMELIRHRILQLNSEAREEILTAQPGGARPVEQMKTVQQKAVASLAAGLSLRTLYQPGALTDIPTAAYAAAVSDAGSRIRVLDEPFQRLMVFDRRVAIVPAAHDNSSAAFVEDPAVVSLLVERYERDWSRATVVDWHALAGHPRATGVPAEVGELLSAGLTQKAIASRLKLSERTVASHIARLREHHGAETLFRLGWQMRGVSR